MRRTNPYLSIALWCVLVLGLLWPLSGGNTAVTDVRMPADAAEHGRWRSLAVTPGLPSTAGTVLFNNLRGRGWLPLPTFVPANAADQAKQAEVHAAYVAAEVTGTDPTSQAVTIWTHGGDSGGLVMALAGVDARSEGLLTRGFTIAATGAVDAEGSVSAVGEIPSKVAGARRAGIDVLFIPADNLDEARAYLREDDSLWIVGVSTVDEAVAQLCDWGATDAICDKA
jgi:hypothetical protein